MRVLRLVLLASVALYGVVLASGLGAFGTSAGSAYQYQYSGSVTGSGTIDSSVKGQVSFSVTAKLDDTGATGSCSVNEPATKTKIKCLGVTSMSFGTVGGCPTAVIQGPATINGDPTSYQIVAVDCGTPGVGHDSFSVEADGFARSGTLTSGNITIHGVG